VGIFCRASACVPDERKMEAAGVQLLPRERVASSLELYRTLAMAGSIKPLMMLMPWNDLMIGHGLRLSGSVRPESPCLMIGHGLRLSGSVRPESPLLKLEGNLVMDS
jgi:hypothetical protein